MQERKNKQTHGEIITQLVLPISRNRQVYSLYSWTVTVIRSCHNQIIQDWPKWRAAPQQSELVMAS